MNKCGLQFSNIWGCHLHFMANNILYIYTCAYNFKSIGINQEKYMCLPDKEYIGCHKWERTR